MLAKRVLTAAVGIPVLIGSILAGAAVFTGLVTIAVVFLALEYSRLGAESEAPPLTIVTVVFAAGLPVIFGYTGAAGVTIWAILLVGVLMAAKVFDPAGIGLANISTTVFGVLYTGLLPAMLPLTLENGAVGPWPVLIVFLAVWTADTSAFAVGLLIGKRPLAPQISPNKTVEGAIGSVLITTAVAAAFTYVTDMTLAECLVFGAAVALAALFGDLFESALKREAGTKDSGTILPGHGGLLDRVDSLLAAAPLGYFLQIVFRG